MFTVELKDKDEVEIYLDSEGLSAFLGQLRFLETGKTDHVHFMTSSWGGGDLSEQSQGNGTILIHHLKVLRRD